MGLAALSVYTANAQCGVCAVNNQCTVTPAAPQLCPATLPDGTVGQPYDQDATFYMPTQFQTQGVTVTLNQITVTGITGIPQGLSFTCSAPNCVYFPSQNPPATERGCVKICGVPTIPGNYTIVVSVVAQVSTPIGPVTQPEQFTIPITIVPPPGGNAGFTFNPTQGCGEVCPEFSGIITNPTQPVTYNWDLGNGQTSTVQNPPVQCYENPGEYIVSLETKILGYRITGGTFTASTNAWCGDVEEPSLFGACQSGPDIYFDYANGTNSFTSNEGSANNTTANWSGLNISLPEGQNIFSLTFWDADNVSQDDNLGSAAINLTAPGTINFSTPDGFGSITVTTYVLNTIAVQDTVEVFAIPANPVVTNALAIDSICTGDSILLVTTPSTIYQWYRDTTLIVGGENDSIYVDQTGYYWLNILDQNGCGASSDSAQVWAIPFPPLPGVFFTNNFQTINTNTNPNQFDIQWYFSATENGNGLPIPNQNGATISPSQNGFYFVEILNALGCSVFSDTVEFIKSGLSEYLSGINTLSLYPNPNNGSFTLKADLLGTEETTISIINLLGQTVYSQNLGKTSGAFSQNINLGLAKGVYTVVLQRQNGAAVRKLVVE